MLSEPLRLRNGSVLPNRIAKAAMEELLAAQGQLPGDALRTLSVSAQLSGGSIESLATAGSPADGRTLAREAYFLVLAQQLLATSPLPLLLTGGIQRRAVAQQVIDSGVAMAGMASAPAIDPTLPGQWLAGREAQATAPRTRLRNKTLAAAALQAVTSRQLARLGQGKPSRTPYSPAVALLLERLVPARRRRGYLTWV